MAGKYNKNVLRGIFVFVGFFLISFAVFASDILDASKYKDYTDLYTSYTKSSFTNSEKLIRIAYCQMRERFGSYVDLKEFVFCHEMVFVPGK